jgi:hypothetical protein
MSFTLNGTYVPACDAIICLFLFRNLTKVQIYIFLVHQQIFV